MAPNYPEGSDHWCPLCHVTVKNVDKHLKKMHHLIGGSEEQRILCSLGTDRTPVEGEAIRCPLSRETGCAAQITNPRHHLRGKHKGITKAKMIQVLRPIRYELAIRQLKELRQSCRENMITHLDEMYQEGEPVPRDPAPSSSQDCGPCQILQAEVEYLRRVNGLLRQELSKLQKREPVVLPSQPGGTGGRKALRKTNRPTRPETCMGEEEAPLACSSSARKRNRALFLRIFCHPLSPTGKRGRS